MNTCGNRGEEIFLTLTADGADVQRHLSDPVWHDVRARRPVVQVEDDDAQDDGEGDQDHGEHDVVDDDRNAQGGLGDLVGQQKHEDSQSDEDRNGESHLLSWGQFTERVTTAELSRTHTE